MKSIVKSKECTSINVAIHELISVVRLYAHAVYVLSTYLVRSNGKTRTSKGEFIFCSILSSCALFSKFVDEISRIVKLTCKLETLTWNFQKLLESTENNSRMCIFSENQL